MRKPVALFGVTIVATLLYYIFIAPGVLAALSLAVPAPSTASMQAVALGWAIAEATVVGLPFVALAVVAYSWPALLPRYIWLAPLGVVVIPTLISSLFNLWALGALRSDFGFGGALAPEVSIPVDVLAAVLGSVLVIVAQRRTAQSPARFRAKAAGTQR